MKNQGWNKQLQQNTKILAFWTFAWVASLALATFGHVFFWEGNKLLIILSIALNAAFGIGMILANIRHIKSLDEMQRKIQLEAMGISLGVGVVGGLNYKLFDTTNLMSGDAEIAFLVILISLTYLSAIIIGQIRYK